MNELYCKWNDIDWQQIDINICKDQYRIYVSSNKLA